MMGKHESRTATLYNVDKFLALTRTGPDFYVDNIRKRRQCRISFREYAAVFRCFSESAYDNKHFADLSCEAQHIPKILLEEVIPQLHRPEALPRESLQIRLTDRAVNHGGHTGGSQPPAAHLKVHTLSYIESFSWQEKEKSVAPTSGYAFPERMFDLVQHLNTNPVIALVGATNHSTKYGNIILKDLLRKGYTVRPVNPRATAVEGQPAFADLKAALAAGPVGLVVYVIPPKLTLQSLQEALALSLKKVWIQPGAGNEDVRAFLDTNGFEYLMDACVMVESRVA